MPNDDICDECGGRHYSGLGDSKTKVCDCRQKRHERRVAKHTEAVTHLQDALSRQDKGGNDAARSAVLLGGLTRALLALLEAAPPGEY